MKYVLLILLYLFGVAYWPFMYAALIYTVMIDMPLAAILMGILLDLLYGAPPAHHPFHALMIPYTLTAIVIVVVINFGKIFISTGERRIRSGK